MYVKSAVILTMLFAGWAGAFFLFPDNLAVRLCCCCRRRRRRALTRRGAQATLACAVAVAVAKAEIGVSIMHDANHGAYSNSGALNAAMAATCDLAGSSSYMWRQQHVVGHHAFTNVVGLDPDIHAGVAEDRAFFRLAHAHAWHPWHVWQHVYLGALYSLLAVKSIYVDDFRALIVGRLGPVTIKRPTAREAALLWTGKALYGAYMLAAPAALSPHSWGRLLALWATINAVTGLMLALMFTVAHVVGDVAYLERGGPSGRAVARGWAAAQVATTADFAHGSRFWTHVSGGLNHQVVHHLFPGVCHCHYPALAPIVLRTAAEFGVPYKVYPSFCSAVAAHFAHLRAMGAPLRVPSLATVG
jgi:fatty acid desaturase